MSLASKIRTLTKSNPTMTSPQIAARFDCDDAYVRAIWHRSGIFKGKHDKRKRYGSKSKGLYVRLPVKEYERLLAASEVAHGKRVDL